MINQFSPEKVLVHSNRIRQIVANGICKPASVEIDPSNICNFACQHCFYKNFRNNNKVIMPRSILFKLIDELNSIDVKAITFTGGGEPTTYPWLKEAITYAKSRDMEVALVTNGLFLDRSLSAIVLAYCKYVRISLDAGSSIVHQKMHGTKVPVYNKIIENLQRLSEMRRKFDSKTTIGISYIVSEDNIADVYSAAKDAKYAGTDYIQFKSVYRPEAPIDLTKYREFLEAARSLEDDNFKVHINYSRFDETIFNNRTYEKCRATPLISVVNADCNVYLCCQHRGNPAYVIGNLREQSFSKIWWGERHKKIIEELDLKKCPPCRYSGYNSLIEEVFVQNKGDTNFL